MPREDIGEELSSISIDVHYFQKENKNNIILKQQDKKSSTEKKQKNKKHKMLKYLKFFVGVFYLFFVLSFIMPLYCILTCKPKRAQEYWSKAAIKSLRLRFKVLGHNIQTNKKTVLLVNHRTQGDFFIHDVVTQYSANFLARFMVAIIFPFCYIFSQLLTRSVWFFRRGGSDLNKFFLWLDKKYETCYRQNLLVYPEGHRMSDASKTGKLKTGMLRYAYERNIDTQIIIVVGIEDAFNEKKFHVSWGPTNITCQIDDIIKPGQFDSFEDFFQVVDKRFSELFTQTYMLHYKKD